MSFNSLLKLTGQLCRYKLLKICKFRTSCLSPNLWLKIQKLECITEEACLSTAAPQNNALEKKKLLKLFGWISLYFVPKCWFTLQTCHRNENVLFWWKITVARSVYFSCYLLYSSFPCFIKCPIQREILSSTCSYESTTSHTNQLDHSSPPFVWVKNRIYLCCNRKQ